MLEMGTSGLMSGEGKPPAACRPRSSALPRLYDFSLELTGVDIWVGRGDIEDPDLP